MSSTFRNVLFNFCIFGSSSNFSLLFISNSISLWLESILCVGLVLLSLLRLVIQPNVVYPGECSSCTCVVSSRIWGLIKERQEHKMAVLYNKLFLVVFGQGCRRGEVSHSKRPSRDRATIQKGKRVRELLEGRGIGGGAHVSRWCHLAAR